MELDRFSSLIETLYDAALNPMDWPRAAQMFARSFDTESCAIFQLNLAQGSAGIVGITENFDAKAIADYEAYYLRKDVVAIRMAQSGTGRAMLSTEVVRESEFLDSEIFVDFARPMRLGFFWAVGGVIEVEQPRSEHHRAFLNGAATVALVVSSGPAMVAVPNVVGDTQAAASTAAGFSLMTSPEATVLLDWVVTAPTVSPAAVIAVVAAAWVSPTTFGTLTVEPPDPSPPQAARITVSPLELRLAARLVACRVGPGPLPRPTSRVWSYIAPTTSQRPRWIKPIPVWEWRST